MENEKMYNQSELIKMGWTKTMITKLLPAPKEKKNPYYASAAPMKLWAEKEVLAVMDTDQFKEEKLKADKRKSSSNRATETKRKNMEAHVAKKISEISVKVIDGKKLRQMTLTEKQKWYKLQADQRDEFYERDAYSADEETVARWIVNYIRHNLTEYDEELYNMKGKVGVGEAYWKYKSAVLDKIAEAYPQYANECKRQIGKW